MLRLEHVDGVMNGRLKFELRDKTEEVAEENRWGVVPYWPDWWPQKPPEESGSLDTE